MDPPTDDSVRPPEPQRAAMVLIAGLGLVSLLCGIGAETTRVQSYDVAQSENGQAICVYPPSHTYWYTAGAVAALCLAQAAAFLCGSFSWCPHTRRGFSTAHTSVVVILIVEIVFTASAIATLITAHIQDASLSTGMPDASGKPTCGLLDAGVFLTGSVLTLFSVILSLAYYLMSMRSLQDLWLHAYSASPLVDLQVFSQDASAPVPSTRPARSSDLEGEGLVL